MALETKCDHDWQPVKEPVKPDNPKFNHQKHFYIHSKKCSKCKKTMTVDLSAI